MDCFLTTEEIDAIGLHRNEMPQTVALRLKASANLRPQIVALQIDCRQRLKEKVPSWSDVPALYIPSSISTQQCSSEVIARWRASLVEGSSLLDLTGGLGVDCFFMSAGVDCVSFVEANKTLLDAVEYNYALLGANNVSFVCDTAEHFLSSATKRVSTVFIDPSRRSDSGARVFQLSDCSPDVTQIAHRMLAMADVVLVKLSPLLDIALIARSLPNLTDIYVVGANGECKELMVRMRSGDDLPSVPTVHALMFQGLDVDPTQHFSFPLGSEREAKALMSDLPTKGMFLFDPSTVMMKAGCFRLLSSKYGVALMTDVSHIYASAVDVPSFPGRRFLVSDIFSMSKSSVKSLRAQYPKASVVVRGFPMTAAELKKRLGVDEDDQWFIFGTSSADGRLLLIVCHRI